MEDRGDRGRLEDIRGRAVASAWHNARKSQHVLQREPLYRQTTRGVFFVVREKAGMKHKVVKKVTEKDLEANILSGFCGDTPFAAAAHMFPEAPLMMP